LVLKPVEGAVSLAFMLTVFSITEGVYQIAASIAYRDALAASWGWMRMRGISDLELAAIIILGWPMSAGWAFGLLVGINLTASGWAIVMAEPTRRNLAQAVGNPIAAMRPPDRGCPRDTVACRRKTYRHATPL